MNEDGRGSGDAKPAGRPPPRRRHRRVDAPPTNPEADHSDDVPAGPPPPASPDTVKDAPGGAPPDAREAWILAQRPPHWD